MNCEMVRRRLSETVGERWRQEWKEEHLNEGSALLSKAGATPLLLAFPDKQLAISTS